MSFAQTLTTLLLGFILHEAPNIRRHGDLQLKFNESIGRMVALHLEVSDGRLIGKQTDALLLSSVNYRETRMRLPAPEGDCRFEHPLVNVPTGQWPTGYKPVMKQVCRAVGPMQLNKGNVRHLPYWAEVQREFKEREWGPKNPGKENPLTVAQLAEPKTNVRLAYSVLEHWKAECRQKDGSVAPVGVWLTAYRQGRCPFIGKSGKYFIDSEAILRCDMASKLRTMLVAERSMQPSNEPELVCTYPR